MSKIPCMSGPSEESWREKFRACPLPADCCVFGRFGRLSPSPLHSADALFDSGVNWWIHVSFIVMYRRKQSFLLRVSSFKQRSKSWIRCCFCSTVSKRGTHLEYNYLTHKFSCTTLNTVPLDIFRMSAISCNFTFRSDKMIFRILFVFSGVATSVGRPGRLRCLFDRVWNLHTIGKWLFSMGNFTGNTFQAIAELERYFYPSKNSIWLQHETCFD